MRRNWIVIGVLILLAGVAVFQTISAQQKKAAIPAGVGPKPGLTAPLLELPALDGKTYTVSGEREKPLLLNFWASWCIPCREESPDIKRLYDQYSDRFDVYAVNVTSQDELAEARKMVKEFDFKFPVLLDYQGISLSIYQFQAIPTSFLIDKKGKVVEIINVVEPKHLEEKILELSK
jgi:thiol-disulfide isomerase/thioredoxin